MSDQRRVKPRRIYLPDAIWEALRRQADYQYDSNGGDGISISALVYDILDYYVSSPVEEQRRIRREVHARRLEKQIERLDNTPKQVFREFSPSGRTGVVIVKREQENASSQDDALWDFGSVPSNAAEKNGV